MNRSRGWPRFWFGVALMVAGAVLVSVPYWR